MLERIDGLKQAGLLKYGIKPKMFVILSWFIEDVRNDEKSLDELNHYQYVDYQSYSDNLLVDHVSPQTISRWFNDFVKKGILERFNRNTTYFRLTTQAINDLIK